MAEPSVTLASHPPGESPKSANARHLLQNMSLNRVQDFFIADVGIDIAALKTDSHTGYPEPFRQAVLGRSRKRLGNAAGLDQFGVNLTTLKPGAASSQRHWHANEDELVCVLAGEVVLCEDDGETVLRPGDAAGWKSGIASSIAAPRTRSISKSAAARPPSAPTIPISTCAWSATNAARAISTSR